MCCSKNGRMSIWLELSLSWRKHSYKTCHDEKGQNSIAIPSILKI